MERDNFCNCLLYKLNSIVDSYKYEENSPILVCWCHLYGLDRFFIAKIILCRNKPSDKKFSVPLVHFKRNAVGILNNKDFKKCNGSSFKNLQNIFLASSLYSGIIYGPEYSLRTTSKTPLSENSPPHLFLNSNNPCKRS